MRSVSAKGLAAVQAPILLMASWSTSSLAQPALEVLERLEGFSIDVPPGIVVANFVFAHGGVSTVEPKAVEYSSAHGDPNSTLIIVSGVNRIDAEEILR